MNEFRIIGLTGTIGSGKDTVAEILRKKFLFERVAFADAIRKGISAMFDISIDELNDRNVKEQPCKELCGQTPRYAMQKLGTEWGRKLIADDIWIKTVEFKIQKYKEFKIPGVVITDIRFEDEAAWLRNLSKDLWHVRRKNNPFVSEINVKHESENGVKVLDHEIIINNDSTIDQLEQIVEMAFHDQTI